MAYWSNSDIDEILIELVVQMENAVPSMIWMGQGHHSVAGQFTPTSTSGPSTGYMCTSLKEVVPRLEMEELISELVAMEKRVNEHEKFFIAYC